MSRSVLMICFTVIVTRLLKLILGPNAAVSPMTFKILVTVSLFQKSASVIPMLIRKAKAEVTSNRGDTCLERVSESVSFDPRLNDRNSIAGWRISWCFPHCRVWMKNRKLTPWGKPWVILRPTQLLMVSIILP